MKLKFKIVFKRHFYDIFRYHPVPRPMMPVEVPAAPVHVPVHVPVASYHRPVYQAPYQSASYQRQVSPSRPIIEIPIEIPIPVHVPIPVSVQSLRDQTNEHDHDASASETDQVAIVYYDPDGHDGQNDHEEHLEPQTSESHENIFRVVPGQKGYPFMSRPLPDTQSPAKMKLWREYIGAKHAANPGVRYVPVAVANDEPQAQTGHDSLLHQEQSEPQESQSQPTFVILTDDGPDGPHEHH